MNFIGVTSEMWVNANPVYQLEVIWKLTCYWYSNRGKSKSTKLTKPEWHHSYGSCDVILKKGAINILLLIKLINHCHSYKGKCTQKCL